VQSTLVLVDYTQAGSPAPKWARELSPGFTRVYPGLCSPLALALKGPSGAAKIGPEPLSESSAHSSLASPFRAERLFWLTQGKPWAMLFRPLWATDWNVQTPEAISLCYISLPECGAMFPKHLPEVCEPTATTRWYVCNHPQITLNFAPFHGRVTCSSSIWAKGDDWESSQESLTMHLMRSMQMV
jgi:hypothetical protein